MDTFRRGREAAVVDKRLRLGQEAASMQAHGFVVFARIIMIIAGGFLAVDGMVGLFATSSSGP